MTQGCVRMTLRALLFEAHDPRHDEGDEGDKAQIDTVHHSAPAPIDIQVIRITTPTTIAKA